MKKIRLSFSPKLAIDLGSNWVRIWGEEDEKIKDEQCCLAIKQGDSQIIAVGNQALAAVNRQNTDVVWPVVSGEVADKKQVQALLKMLLVNVWRPRLLVEPTVAISIPVSSSNLEKQDLCNLLLELGAKEVITVAQPLAGLFGAGLRINDPSSSLGLCLGAGIAEAVAVSMGSVALWQSQLLSGNWLIWQLEALLTRKLGAAFDRAEVEQLLHQAASLSPTKGDLELMGKDIKTGLPKRFNIEAALIQDLLKQYAQRYAELVMRLLVNLPAGLTQDSFKRGLLLMGGAAQLQGLEQYLSDYLNLPVALVQDPEHAVIKGLVYVLNHLREFKDQSTNLLKALPLS